MRSSSETSPREPWSILPRPNSCHCRSGTKLTERRSRIVLVLVNGPPDSVQGPRARALFGGEVPIEYKVRGRFGSLRAIAEALRKVSAEWVYCFDLGFPGSLLAALRSRFPSGVRLAYEIGVPARPLLAN